MPQELDLLKLVCHKLDQSNISYMLTGSVAANFYAVPRMSRNIDIVIDIDKDDEERVFKLFHRDFYVNRHALATAIQQQKSFNLIHADTVIRIDVFVKKSSPYPDVRFERRRQVPIDQSHVWMITAEDLIISKLIWAKDSLSELQLNDVKNLFLSSKNLDIAYIESWIDKLDLKAIYARVKVNG